MKIRHDFEIIRMQKFVVRTIQKIVEIFFVAYFINKRIIFLHHFFIIILIDINSNFLIIHAKRQMSKTQK